MKILKLFSLLLAASLSLTGCGDNGGTAAVPAPKIDSISLAGEYRSYIPMETGLVPMVFQLNADGSATYIKDVGRYEVEGSTVFFVFKGQRVLGFTRTGPHKLEGNAQAKGVEFVRVGDSLELKRLDEEVRIRLNLRMLASIANRTFVSESLNGALGSGGSYKGQDAYAISELNSSPFLAQLKSVAGEDYRRLDIPSNAPGKLSVQTMDGRTIEYTW